MTAPLPSGNTNTEPVITGAIASAIIFGGVNLLQSFGLFTLTIDQTTQLNAFLGLVLPFVIARFVRNRVTPV